MSSLMASSLVVARSRSSGYRLLGGDAVRHQRHLEDSTGGVVPDAALAGERGGIEEVRPAGRHPAAGLVGVHGEHRAVCHDRHPVVGGPEVRVHLVPLDQPVVERLEQRLVGVQPEVAAGVHDVPRDLPGFDLGPHRRVRGVPVVDELHAGELGVRLLPRPLYRILVRAALCGERERHPVLPGRVARVTGERDRGARTGRCRISRPRRAPDHGSGCRDKSGDGRPPTHAGPPPSAATRPLASSLSAATAESYAAAQGGQPSGASSSPGSAKAVPPRAWPASVIASR